jgi:hypothetical protein
MTYLIGATIFFGCIWLLGAMFSGSKEGGTDAVKGCGSCLLAVVAAGVGILGLSLMWTGNRDLSTAGFVLILIACGLFKWTGLY